MNSNIAIYLIENGKLNISKMINNLSNYNIENKNIKIYKTINGTKYYDMLAKKEKCKKTKNEEKKCNLQVNNILKSKNIINQLPYISNGMENFSLDEIIEYLNFNEILKNACSRGCNNNIILFSKNYDILHNITKIMKYLPENWDVLALSWIQNNDQNDNQNNDQNSNIKFGKKINKYIMIPYSILFYKLKDINIEPNGILISKNGLKKLKKYWMPMDFTLLNKLDTLKNIGILNLYTVL